MSRLNLNSPKTFENHHIYFFNIHCFHTCSAYISTVYGLTLVQYVRELFDHHHVYSKIMDQPGIMVVANPARVQLKRENDISLCQYAPENLVSRDVFGRPVPCQPPLLLLHSQG